MRGMLQKLGMEEGEAIEHKWVSKSIESAQRKVENQNFNVRKQLLEYDDVANDQRKVIYEHRSELMATDDVSDLIEDIRGDVVKEAIDLYVPPESLDELWDVPGLTEALKREFGVEMPLQQWLDDDRDLEEHGLRTRILERVKALFEEKRQLAGDEVMRNFEKAVTLQVLDQLWREHLSAMDYLRQGIHLRGFAQRDPKREYKREGFDMFQNMLERLKYEVITVIAKVQVEAEEDVEAVEAERRRERDMQFQHADAQSAAVSAQEMEQQQAVAAGAGGAVPPPPPPQMAEPEHFDKPETFVRAQPKVGRNDPCPCGSGRKYKQCHGRAA
jgi:preprotein translocase subunit SecA